MSKKNSSSFNVISPIDGQNLKTLRLLSCNGIARLFNRNTENTDQNSRAETLCFLRRLCSKIKENRERLIPMLVMETGYIRSDSEEIIDGSIDFLEQFEMEMTQDPRGGGSMSLSFGADADRKIHLSYRPYRRVAAIIPQNASFGTALIVLAAALYSGSKLVLRASLQAGLTNDLLKKMVEESDPPDESVEFVSCLATDFLKACYKSPSVDLIHYIGSNRYVASVLNDSFKSGKTCLLDGQGNGLVYVDRSFPVEKAVKIVTEGAIRYNGETCTSINGVLCHPDIYKTFREGLCDSLGSLTLGHPMEKETNVGPLFSESQTAHIGRLVGSSGGRFIAGGTIDGSYIEPGLVEGVKKEKPLVTEGFMGPIVWLAKTRFKESDCWFNINKYPLSDTILSLDSDQVRSFVTRSRSPRVCINVDSSLESMFEPWGGYPPSGLNPVSIWTQKYLQTFQIDGDERFTQMLGLGTENAHR